MLLLHCREGLIEIRFQIARVFEADRDPDRVVEDAEFGAGLRYKALMCGGCRMGGETLGVAEIVADAEQLERIQDGKGIVLGLPDVESHQGTTKSHLFFGDVISELFNLITNIVRYFLSWKAGVRAQLILILVNTVL